MCVGPGGVGAAGVLVWVGGRNSGAAVLLSLTATNFHANFFYNFFYSQVYDRVPQPLMGRRAKYISGMGEKGSGCRKGGARAAGQGVAVR